MADQEQLYSERTDRLIASHAERALSKLEKGSQVDRDKAVALRERLYSWLMRVNDLVNKPSLSVGAEVAAMLDEELQKGLSEAQTPAATAVLTAWSALPDDLALKLVGRMVSRLYASSQQGLLMSRQDATCAWEATGFHIDPPLRTLLAKVGARQPEPIGYDDNKHYVPTDGSKPFWLRQFAMAVLLPFGPAFQVTIDDRPQVVGDAVALSDHECQVMSTELAQLDDDVRVWKALAAEAAEVLKLPADQMQAAAAKNQERRAEHQAKMQLSVDLARTRLRRLDRYLDNYEAAHPEVGEKFSNVLVEDRVVLIGKYLRAKLADDGLRRVIEGPALSVPADNLPSIVEQLRARLTGLLAVPEDQQDGDEMNNVLSGARAAVPELNVLLAELAERNPDALSSDGVRAALAWLDAQAKPVSA